MKKQDPVSGAGWWVVCLASTLLASMSWTAPAMAMPIVITGETWSEGGVSPDAAACPGAGEVHVAYHAGGQVKYAIFDSNGALLSNVAEGWAGVGDAWYFGPGITVENNGKRHLTYAVHLGGWKMDGYYTSHDNGWAQPLLVQTSKDRGYAPQVAADSQGATMVIHELEGNKSWVNAYRIANGSVAGTTIKVLSSRIDDRMDIVAGPNLGDRHLFVGLPNPGGNILYAHSNDGGQNWLGIGNIEADSCNARVGQPDAAVGPDGFVHLVYGCGSDGDIGGSPSVRYARFDGTAKIFDKVITAPGELQGWHLSLGIGRIAVTSGGAIVAAYLIADGGAIWVTSSDDGGNSWHPPQKIGDKGGTAEGRNVPSAAALGNTVFIAFSDGGKVRLVRGEASDCDPECVGKQCGDDGCGGQCGQCGTKEQCVAGQCECTSGCQPPEFDDVPNIEMTQGKSNPHALDLSLHVSDPDDPVALLEFTELSATPPEAHISLVDGHYVSVMPDANWTGNGQIAVQVSDGGATDTVEIGVAVVSGGAKNYQAPRKEGIALDGNLSDWGDVPEVILEAPKDWAGLQGDAPSALDFRVSFRAAWNGNTLYVAVHVNDDLHACDFDAASMWKGDSIQLGLDSEGNKTGPGYDGDDWEIGAALQNGTTAAPFCWHTPAEVADCPVTYAVGREGNNTVYEVGIPGDYPAKVGFSLLANENDGGDRDGWLEWTPGIGYAKDPSLFGSIEMVEEVAPQVEPEEDLGRETDMIGQDDDLLAAEDGFGGLILDPDSRVINADAGRGSNDAGGNLKEGGGGEGDGGCSTGRGRNPTPLLMLLLALSMARLGLHVCSVREPS